MLQTGYTLTLRLREGERRTRTVTMWKLTIILSVLTLSSVILETEPAKCCLKYRLKPVRCATMRGYSVQKSTGSCDMRAIIFQTKDNKVICADPQEIWTKKRIECLTEKGAQLVKPGKYLIPGY